MAFVHGVLLAFGLILPLGVQNVFIFNQGAVQSRFVRALPAVLTAALCDMLLILAAVLGVSLLILTVSWIKTVLVLAGILFLLYMGLVTWRTPAAAAPAGTEGVPAQPEGDGAGSAAVMGPRRQMLFAASVSLFNPHAILDTIGVIGTSSLRYAGADKVLFAAAAIGVSLVWFLFLAGAGRLAGRLHSPLRLYLNKASALIMWGSALYLGWSFS
ncbi:LysE/ArgO family amino acid transporter [Paenibacillus caseinilyticus]|uniref:LysE family translocator protein n=1 Tax=Paenibacillus mucilaginosus K02 TaxID=997761 RepID=I0BBV3_9BACL|nr:LysE family transporter [Paenibacillus mucilaginosus]AFH59850.1 LysE family translocator protein [Paenibacillus mucilaginosus K02]